MNKYEKTLAQYVTELDDAAVQMAVEKIVRENYEKYNNVEVYKQLFNCIDLTTLRSEDHTESVARFTKRVNDFENEHGDMPNVAALCVYPNYAATVRMNLEVSDVNIACVSGGFPSSQTFSEVKVAETMLAVKDGADEIDIVINVGDMLAGNYEEVCDEIAELKSACGDAHLKVILETGALKTASMIKKASLLAIYSGADFIKTSTGKQEPAATLEAAYVMCQAIKEYYDKTGTMIGFKPAGGISTTADAVKYYCVVAAVLGEDWLTNRYFRIGASRLANNLLSDIWGEEVKYF
ncbi:MAG: deoxyribose-phosphate aldolase [Bacteroidaceae bacterium]|nr:deoxyribose-phosphate aldolase [Bacteroidaceae bacterium]